MIATAERGASAGLYHGATARLLRDDECRFRLEQKSLPLVIEATDATDPESLYSLLERHSETIRKDVARFGAVLLRGFHVRSAEEFEKAILSIDGLRPMGAQFMLGAGRTRLAGTAHVFSTHSINPTGGAFSIGSWHTEGYHHPDVPHYQVFHCARPSWLGGETGLASFTGVYDSLTKTVQEKLAQCAVATSAWSLPVVAKRYGTSEESVRSFCDEAGLGFDDSETGQRVVLTKPNVLRHPLAGTYAISGNLGQALPGFRRRTWDHFLPLYQGWQWSVHRLAWKRRPGVVFALNLLSSILWSILAHPRTAIEYYRSRAEERAARRIRLGARFRRLRELLEPQDVEMLAKEVWRHSSIFSWKRGDILIVDNIQVAHCGMPGLGPRTVHVMKCNALPLHHPVLSGVVELPANSESDNCQPLGSRLAGSALSGA